MRSDAQRSLDGTSLSGGESVVRISKRQRAIHATPAQDPHKMNRKQRLILIKSVSRSMCYRSDPTAQPNTHTKMIVFQSTVALEEEGA
jgi:hypothetical protein